MGPVVSLLMVIAYPAGRVVEARVLRTAAATATAFASVVFCTETSTSGFPFTRA